MPRSHSHPLVDRFRQVRALVLGDPMLDLYTQGAVQRFCPEGPVPVYDVHQTRRCAGGAANTAANLAALGAQVSLVAAIGDDEYGEQLLEMQAGAGIDVRCVLRIAGRKTLTKQRLIANHQLLMRVDEGTTSALDADSQSQLLARLHETMQECELIIVSDYGYGNVTPQIIECLQDRPVSTWLCVDSKHLESLAKARPDIVKPNYAQACKLLGLSMLPETPERCHQMARYKDRLLELTGSCVVALTCDHDGCVVMQAGHEPRRVAARTCMRPRVAGAGDTFLAAMGLAVAAGEPIADAATLASAAAGLVVDKEGTAVCTADELVRCEAGLGRSWELNALAKHLEPLRQQGQRLVLTCGCFDILHHGHVEYLRRARMLGDRLIVAVNSDESIRRLKGPARPINPLCDRLEVLAALDCVDYLLSFDEDKPDRVIKALRPHVFVKGGDYTRDTLPEADLVESLGGQVNFIPMVANRSTTRIIARIMDASPTSPIGVTRRT